MEEPWRVMALQVLDGMPQAMLLVDASGRTLNENAAARRLLEEGDPLVYDRKGRIRGVDAAADAQLDRLLARLHAGRQGDVAAVCLQCRRRPSSVQVVLQRIRHPESDDVVLIIAADTSRYDPPPPFLLEQLFGLTPKEAHAASIMATGGRMLDLERRLQIGKNTARTHLRHFYAKIGVHSHPQLIRSIYCSVLPFLSDKPD